MLFFVIGVDLREGFHVEGVEVFAGFAELEELVGGEHIVID